MKHLPVVFLLLTLTSTYVIADWDYEMEAKEQAEREAAQREQQAKQREAQKVMDEARAKADRGIVAEKRKSLGAAAEGKSDDEVNRLFDEKNRKAMEDADKFQKSATGAGQSDASLKQMTGKSMEELQNMSDEEAEAFAREMEKKYGQ